MKKIFEPFKIGNMTVKNRIVRSATFERGAVNGHIDPSLEKMYKAFADGQVGLIITGMMGTSKNACLSTAMVKMYTDGFVGELKKLTDIAHEDGTKVVVQMNHCGVKSMSDGEDQIFGPSEITMIPDRPARAMTKADIKEVVDGFGESALRCKQGGADGVQIHVAHGYLLSQFMSPFFNKREDEYGGSVENRARIVFEVYESVRAKVGKDFPVMVKINFTDFVEPTVTFEECKWVCKELEKRGLDGIELSAGAGNDGKSTPSRRVADESQEASFIKEAIELADYVNIPVISVGGYRTPSVIEKSLNAGKIVAVAMSRPLICEPNLVKRWADGDVSKAKCLSCNKCFRPSPVFGCQNEAVAK